MITQLYMESFDVFACECNIFSVEGGILTPNVRRQSYLGLTKSISWLLIISSHDINYVE